MVSRLRDARNAALVTHASGSQQDELGPRMGLVRPLSVSRTAWRRALLAGNAYRGLPTVTRRFLEGALSDWAVNLRVVIDPSRPTALYSAGQEFTQDLVGRTVRIEGTLYRVVGPWDVSQGPFANELLELCPIATGDWLAADWSREPVPREVDAEFHAFWIREDQVGPRTQRPEFGGGDVSGTAIVYVTSDVADVYPPSWLLPEEDMPAPEEEGNLDPQPPSDLPAGMDPMGIICDPDDQEGGAPDGPYPAFLGDDFVLADLENACRSMVSLGFKVKFRRMPDLIPED